MIIVQYNADLNTKLPEMVEICPIAEWSVLDANFQV